MSKLRCSKLKMLQEFWLDLDCIHKVPSNEKQHKKCFLGRRHNLKTASRERSKMKTTEALMVPMKTVLRIRSAEHYLLLCYTYDAIDLIFLAV